MRIKELWFPRSSGVSPVKSTFVHRRDAGATNDAQILNMSQVLFFLVFLLSLNVADVRAATPVPDGMILVPTGKFTMGTNKSERTEENVPRTYDDARPEHSATIPAFYIDKTEVTNADYLKFCQSTNYPVPPDWKKGMFPASEADFPVTRVSWFEAAAYARWAGKRLPTEAEWEKAARGTDGRTYPWGNEWDVKKLIWGRSTPDKVGSKPAGASPYGVLDMAGNVYEWTSDWYAAYPNAPVTFPEYNQTLKVIRGGAFSGYDFATSTYFRSVNYPRARSQWIGFRCAKDAT